MAKVNYIKLMNSIVLNYEGKTFTLSNGDKRYDAVIQCLKDSRTKNDPAILDLIPDIVDLEGKFKKSGMIYRDGQIVLKNEPMPPALTERIIQFQEEGLPFDAFEKFWENLQLNPNFNSRNQLFGFLEHNGHPLTEDGCFIAYRSVRKNFLDQHSGKFDNSPGQVVSMPREQVDENPNQTCSSGLHVASHKYAQGFVNDGRLLEVKVNPRDVVAVPTDYDGEKMRVCRFEVVRECDGIKEGALYREEVEEQEHDEEVFSEADKSRTYLVRFKGQKKWDKIEADSFQDAAEKYHEQGEGLGYDDGVVIYVRKGSNKVEKFEF